MNAEPKYKLELKGYVLSTHYDLLWELIHKGYRVPCYVVYTDKYGPNELIWDVVEAKVIYERYSITSRGRSCCAENNFDGFKKVCIISSLHFILPNYK